MYQTTIVQRFIMAILFCCLSPLLAYADTERALQSSALSEEAFLFQEIPSVYSASKYEQKVTEAPSSVSIITADEIKKYGYRIFGDILESIRGFQVTNDRNYQYLGVRGFGLPSDYNSRILVLVDGLRINDNIYDSPGIGMFFPVEIDLIDRIEVIRGPSSSLYGTSAFFAVVNVITKRGRDYKGSEVSGSVGSLETYKGRFTYGNKYESGLETLVSASYYDTGGEDRLFIKEFNDPSTNNGIAEDLDYDRFKNFFAEFVFKDFTLQGNYHNRKTGIPTAPWDTIFNDSSQFAVDRLSWLDLKYDHTYDNELALMARVNYNHFKYYGEYPSEGDPAFGEPPVVINDDSSRGKWWYGEFQLTRMMDKHRVTAGASYQDNIHQDQKTYYIGVSDWGEFDDKRDSSSWSVFLQDEFPIADKLILNTGVRYDEFDTFGGTTNPRVALIYNPFEKSSFKLVYGQAFRAPNYYELFFNDGDSQKANPYLDPETIKTYELIYEQYSGDHFRWTAVGFYYKTKDLISQVTDPADGLLFFQNLNEVKAKGAEFELEGKWENGMEGRISYTYQRTEDQGTGKILTNSPKHLAKLNCIVPVVGEKLFLGMEEQYTSKRKTLLRNEAEGFFITNVTLFNQNTIKGLEASFSVYNLFDKIYGDPGAGEHLQDIIKQDGRTVLFELTYAF
jgi:outer membrane receptor for ferrienterochelin and colicins